MAVAPVSGEPVGAFAGELEAVSRSAHGGDVTAVSAGETRVLLWKAACRNRSTAGG